MVPVSGTQYALRKYLLKEWPLISLPSNGKLGWRWGVALDFKDNTGDGLCVLRERKEVGISRKNEGQKRWKDAKGKFLLVEALSTWGHSDGTAGWAHFSCEVTRLGGEWFRPLVWCMVPSLHGKKMGKQWKQWLTIFLDSKITADGDCSHEIKRRLLLGRKVMTNLDSIFKSRDIALPTKVHLVKAMVFQVVMYGCESWTIKKAEHQRIDAFELWCWRRLESPLDCKEIQPVHPKDQSWVFIGRTDAEAETPILWPPDAKSWLIWKDPDARKDWRQEEKGMTENEMVGWHHWLNGHGFGGPAVGDGQGSLVCCIPWGRKESDTTERLNWTDTHHLLPASCQLNS